MPANLLYSIDMPSGIVSHGEKQCQLEGQFNARGSGAANDRAPEIGDRYSIVKHGYSIVDNVGHCCWGSLSNE